MSRCRLRRALLAGPLLALGMAAAPPGFAHHSFAAYDSTRTRTLTGAVKSFRWANPHVGLGILVETGPGSPPQEWSIETSSPAILTRFGWTRNSLKLGDRITVICNPLADGSPSGRLHTAVLLQTGQTLRTKLSTAAE
jgi:Family of unknown function (DUF6152)